MKYYHMWPEFLISHYHCHYERVTFAVVTRFTARYIELTYTRIVIFPFFFIKHLPQWDIEYRSFQDDFQRLELHKCIVPFNCDCFTNCCILGFEALSYDQRLIIVSVSFCSATGKMCNCKNRIYHVKCNETLGK